MDSGATTSPSGHFARFAVVIGTLALTWLLVLIGAPAATGQTTSAPAAFGARAAIVATIPVGNGSWAVAVNPTTKRLYVVNRDSNSVSVIDTSVNHVVNSITAPTRVWDVAVNPTTNRIYITGASGLYVIDGETNQRIGELAGTYAGVGVDEKTNRVFAAGIEGFGTNTWNVTLSEIDGSTNAVVAKVTLESGPAAGSDYLLQGDVAVNPITNRVYVTYASRWRAVDGADLTVLASGDGSARVEDVAVNNQANRFYIAAGNQLEIYDGTTNAQLTTIHFADPCNGGEGVRGVGVNPETNRVYASGVVCAGTSPQGYYERKFLVIDGQTNQVVETFQIGQGGVAVDPTTHRVYAANHPYNGTEPSALANTVSVISDAGADDDAPVISNVTAYPRTLVANGRRSTRITFSISENGSVRMVIRNSQGSRVFKTSGAVTKGPGVYYFDWNGTNERNRLVRAGVYKVSLTPTDKAGNTGRTASVRVTVTR